MTYSKTPDWAWVRFSEDAEPVELLLNPVKAFALREAGKDIRALVLKSELGEYAEALKTAGKTIQHNISRAEVAEERLRTLQVRCQEQGVKDGNAISQALLSAYERGRAEHVDLIDKLDSALCQFLNNAADEYDPRVWIPSVKRDFAELGKVYNECHVAGLMDIQRAARTIRQLLEGKG